MIAAATVFLDLLLMRALDDVRDLAYDQRFNPGRPLASGAEQTYATALGLRGAVCLALAAPALSAVLLAARSQAPPEWTPAAVLPLAVPAAAGYRFLRGRNRRPSAAPALHLVLTFTGYAALGPAR